MDGKSGLSRREFFRVKRIPRFAEFLKFKRRKEDAIDETWVAIRLGDVVATCTP
jgi:hypothetical protein